MGDFNFWDRRAHPMCTRHGFGVWEMFVPTFDLRGQKYGYHIVPQETARARVRGAASRDLGPARSLRRRIDAQTSARSFGLKQQTGRLR